MDTLDECQNLLNKHSEEQKRVNELDKEYVTLQKQHDTLLDDITNGEDLEKKLPDLLDKFLTIRKIKASNLHNIRRIYDPSIPECLDKNGYDFIDELSRLLMECRDCHHNYWTSLEFYEKEKKVIDSAEKTCCDKMISLMHFSKKLEINKEKLKNVKTQILENLSKQQEFCK